MKKRPMKLTIAISMSPDAFRDGYASPDLASILRDYASTVETDGLERTLRDADGKVVGQAKVSKR